MKIADQITKILVLTLAVVVVAIMARNAGGFANIFNATFGEFFRTATSLARS